MADDYGIRMPGISDRTVIIGRTGSGKTFGGLHLLSWQLIDEMPWVVIDFKRDAAIGRIPYAKSLELGETPEEPGVYILQPRPTASDYEALDAQLNGILEQGDIGLFVDEGFMLAESSAFDTVLMQGRSKHVPVIICTQRPVYVSRFVFSEASFIQVFHIVDRRDRKTISEFTPLYRDSDEIELDPFYSWCYEVGENRLLMMPPVPMASVSHALMADRLEALEYQETAEEIPRRVRVFI